MSRTRLSVIIPGYNNPDAWWCRCIDSVLKNTTDEDEIICVDDGSSVRPMALHSYQAQNPRVKVIYRDKNGGLPVARNAGLEVSRGEYVTFVDSDDALEDNIYSAALARIRFSLADIVVFGVRSIWINERLYRENVPTHEKNCAIIPSPEDVKKLLDNRLLNYAWNKIFRRDFLIKNSISFDKDGVPCEDIIFVLQCIMAGAKWWSVPQIGINYYRTHGSLLSGYKPTYCAGKRLAAKAWLKYISDNESAKVYFSGHSEISEIDLLKGEWDNIWRRNSPYSFSQKWQFLTRHKEIAAGCPILFFIKRIIYTYARMFLYIPCVQRWHIKRIYPDVMKFHK